MSKQDGVAPQIKVENLTNDQRAFIPNDIPQGFITSHAIGNYYWIFSKITNSKQKVMLSLGSSTNRFIFFYLLTVCLSCTKKGDEINEKSILFREISTNSISDVDYLEIYSQANDSIMSGIENGLPIYGYQSNCVWRIDSLMCFNKEGNRFVSAILNQDQATKANSDGLDFFYGAKINSEWHLFSGAAIILPREQYQKDIHTPLSFEKMHEIAMEEIFIGYLIKDGKGEWQINEKFFEDMVNKNANLPGYGGCIECKTEEEYFLHLSKLNWLSKHTVLREDEVEMSYNESLKLLKLRFPLRPFTKYIVPWKVVIKAYRESDPSNILIEYIQSETNFEETEFIGDVSFKNIHLNDNLTFNIEFYFKNAGNHGTKPLVLTRSVNKLRRETKPPA